MEKGLIIELKSRFDSMAYIDEESGIEFWYARELQTALGYSEWRNFTNVVDKAKISCEAVTGLVSNHFVDVN
ncbi:DNA damage-inducible protein D, partial [bacterium]|nr:DNA damage-inducible protein D [bacterium]